SGTASDSLDHIACRLIDTCGHNTGEVNAQEASAFFCWQAHRWGDGSFALPGRTPLGHNCVIVFRGFSTIQRDCSLLQVFLRQPEDIILIIKCSCLRQTPSDLVQHLAQYRPAQASVGKSIFAQRGDMLRPPQESLEPRTAHSAYPCEYFLYGLLACL